MRYCGDSFAVVVNQMIPPTFEVIRRQRIAIVGFYERRQILNTSNWICLVSGYGIDVEYWHCTLQGIGINVKDRAICMR